VGPSLHYTLPHPSTSHLGVCPTHSPIPNPHIPPHPSRKLTHSSYLTYSFLDLHPHSHVLFGNSLNMKRGSLHPPLTCLSGMCSSFHPHASILSELSLSTQETSRIVSFENSRFVLERWIKTHVKWKHPTSKRNLTLKLYVGFLLDQCASLWWPPHSPFTFLSFPPHLKSSSSHWLLSSLSCFVPWMFDTC
jgi:hypothetical protein